MFVATVKLSWKKSVSTDITFRKITINKNGEEAVVEVSPEVSEYVLDIEASSNVSFKTEVLDSEGKTVSSDLYTFVIGDLQDPQPDTELTHEVLSVREV